MSRWRALENTLIVGVLATFVVSLPSPWDVHARARRAVGGMLSAIGLCQPEWRLFAPNVPKENARLSAEVVLADGSSRLWESPSFSRHRSALERFREGQLPKLYDTLRRDRARATWQPLADRATLEVARGERVREIRLRRSVRRVLPPNHGSDDRADRAPSPSDPPARAHVFYERRAR